MARRRRKTRTITRYVRRGYRKRKGFLTGNMGNMVLGAGFGAVSGMIPQFAGGFTNPIIAGALGYYFKKPALMGIAGYELGRALSPFGNSNGGMFKSQG